MTPPSGLDARRRGWVDEALADLRDAPRPRDRAPLGCVVALPGFLLLLVIPPLGRSLGLPPGVGPVLLGVGFLTLAAGLILWFTAGGAVRAHAKAGAEAALRRLEAWSPGAGAEQDEEAVRAATLLVHSAFTSYGPTTAETFEAADARERLGAALPLVEDVERYLVERNAAYPVFTEAPQVPDAAADGSSGGDPPRTQPDGSGSPDP